MTWFNILQNSQGSAYSNLHLSLDLREKIVMWVVIATVNLCNIYVWFCCIIWGHISYVVGLKGTFMILFKILNFCSTVVSGTLDILILSLDICGLNLNFRLQIRWVTIHCGHLHCLQHKGDHSQLSYFKADIHIWLFMHTECGCGCWWWWLWMGAVSASTAPLL